MICWWWLLWSLLVVRGQDYYDSGEYNEYDTAGDYEPEEDARPTSCSFSKPRSTCKNAEHGSLDANGEDCWGYQWNCENCGTADNRWFKANTSCCACGGGVPKNASVCETTASSPIPVSGVCSCPGNTTCSEGGLAGCPLPDGNRSTTGYDISCDRCLCASPSPTFTTMDKACSANWPVNSEEVTVDFLVARGALRQLVSLIGRVMVSVGSIESLWQTRQKWRHNLLKRDNLREFDYLQDWMSFFLGAITQNTDIGSCSVHLQSTGETIMLKSGGCERPFEATFITSVTDVDATLGYRIGQAEDCMQTTSYSFACDWSRAFLDTSSSFSVRVAHINSTGQWDMGHKKHNSSHEAWWNDMKQLPPFKMAILAGGYTSPLDGSPEFGVGIVLHDEYETGDRAFVKCDMGAAAVSDFLALTVGGGARYFLFNRNYSLAASSHGATIQESGSFVHLPNASDIVVRTAGRFLVGLLETPNATLEWSPWDIRTLSTGAPELRVKLVIYFAFYNGVYAAYVNPPRCDHGRYMDVESVDVDIVPCKRCPTGRHSPRGQVVGWDCPSCPMGSYSDTRGSTICLTCTAGNYQDEPGQTACKVCPNHTTSHPGSKKLHDCVCQMGYWSPAGATGSHCLECTEGLNCVGGVSRPYAMEAFYKIADEVAFACSGGSSNPCLGGNVSDPDASVCEEGYGGVGCSRCVAGYYRFGRDCFQCQVNEDIMRFHYVLLLIFFYFIRVVVNSKYKSFYIVFSFLQVFSVQGAFNVGWPRSVKHVMRVFATANLQPDLFLPFCHDQPPLTDLYIMNMCSPWVFMLIDAIVAVLWRLWQRLVKCAYPEPRYEQRGSKVVQTTSGTSIDLADITEILQLQRSRADMCRDFASQSLANMRLMYLLLASKTLDMLFCTPVKGGQSRLSADVNIVCWQGSHMDYFPVVLLSALCYVIGMPLAYIAVLWRGYQRNALYSPLHLKRFGILYARFEPRYFWWELVILFRRFLTVVIKSAFNLRTAEFQAGGYLGIFQAASMIFVMGISLFAHAYARPFCNPYLDFGDAVYLGVTGLSCILGICFSAAQTYEEVEVFELLFFINLGLALIVTAWLLWLDIEGHHPVIKSFRLNLCKKLRLDSMTHRITDRARGMLHKGNIVKFEETICGVDCSSLQSSAFLTQVMQSALAHSMQDHLKVVLDIAVSHCEVHIEPLKKKIWYMVELPPGTSQEEVHAAVLQHSHTDATEKLLTTLLQALGRQESRTSTSFSTSI